MHPQTLPIVLLLILSSITQAATLYSTPFDDAEALPVLLITGTTPAAESTNQILPQASDGLQLSSLPLQAPPVTAQQFPLLDPSYRPITVTAPSFNEILPQLSESLSVAEVQSVPEPSTGLMALFSVLLLWRRKIS